MIPDKVKNYYGGGSNFNYKITYISQSKPLGMAHSISLTEGLVNEDKFTVILIDNLISYSISKFVKMFERSDYDAYLLFSEFSHPQDFRVAKFSLSGKLIGFVEKAKFPPSNYVIIGIYFFLFL